MVLALKPKRGGFLRPFGCGEFIKEFLLGHGPYFTPKIVPETGAPQTDIFFQYKTALIRATALDKATRHEEMLARRERRTISPDNIDLTRLSCRYTEALVKTWQEIPQDQVSFSDITGTVKP
ncbi:hypothetical protein ACFLWE_00365 [Chloroflexota bacterium]